MQCDVREPMNNVTNPKIESSKRTIKSWPRIAYPILRLPSLPSVALFNHSVFAPEDLLNTVKEGGAKSLKLWIAFVVHLLDRLKRLSNWCQFMFPNWVFILSGQQTTEWRLSYESKAGEQTYFQSTFLQRRCKRFTALLYSLNTLTLC